MRSMRETLTMVVVMAVLGAATVGVATHICPRDHGAACAPAVRSEAPDAARSAEPGMPATPVVLFGVLMLAGLGALALLSSGSTSEAPSAPRPRWARTPSRRSCSR